MAYFNTIASRQIPAATIFTAPKATFAKRVMAFLSLYNERRQLAKLGDQALMDIGVTRLDADIEAARPLWDTPAQFLAKRG